MDETTTVKPFPRVQHPEWCNPWFCEDLGHNRDHREPVAIFTPDGEDRSVRIYRARLDELFGGSPDWRWLAGTDQMIVRMGHEGTHEVKGVEVPAWIEVSLTAGGCRAFAAELLAAADLLDGPQ